jgi:hypothetical protein
MTLDFLQAVRQVMADARKAVTITTRTFVLPYDGLVSELVTEHGLTESTVHQLLFEATMSGDLVPYWRAPSLNTLNFSLVPKEGITQDA